MLTDSALSALIPDPTIDTGLKYLVLSGPDKGSVMTSWVRGPGKQTLLSAYGGYERATLLNPPVGQGDVVIALGAFEGVDPGLPFAVQSVDMVDGQRVVRSMDQQGNAITLTRWVLSPQTVESRKACEAMQEELDKSLSVVLEGFLARDWSDHAREFLADVNMQDHPVPAVSEVKITLELSYSSLAEDARREVYKISDRILKYRSLEAVQTVSVTFPPSECRCETITTSHVRRALGDRLSVSGYISKIEVLRTSCIYCS